MSLFVTFEGGEGSGKSFQARALYRKLTGLAIPVLLTHEPGGTPVGERLARLLKWARDTSLSPMTELMLFNAARAELVSRVIRPALNKGQTVLCDRYADSTIAYQGYGRGLDLTLVEDISQAATQGLMPGLIVLLDIPPEEGLNRKKGRQQDRFQQESLAFHRRVRGGFLKLAAQEPERWLVIDAAQTREKIAAIIWTKVSQLLSRKVE